MKKYAMETTVGVFVVIGIFLVGYVTVRLGDIGIVGDDSYSLYARFTSVSGLRAGNAVEMHGIEIGRVESLSIDQEEQVAVVELKIQRSVTVYDDAIVSIKTSGLIGDKYVQVDPGGAGDELQPGDTIIDTEPSINVGDLISRYAFGSVDEDGASGDAE
jgi:phospholipid/cholesterol/gamma-HCH transport system substrate-binding protein